MSERALQKLKLLEQMLKEQGVKAPAREAIAKRADSSTHPLSFAQKRLWFLNHLEPGSQYNDHFNLRLQGPLKVPALQWSLNQIVQRHEALRATFHAQQGEPMQKIAPPTDLPLTMIDLRQVPEENRMARATELAIAEARAPFDLQKGPLLRAQLLRLGDEDHLLLLTLHHIAIDGWSRGVFLRELTALYPAAASGNFSELPPLPIQYADFAAWQTRWIQRETRQLEYWKKQLSGAPALLEWPADFSRPELITGRGARLLLELPKSLTDSLTELSQRENCTLFMTLLTGFQALAARYTGQEDIIVGTPIANRNRAEIENLIGVFVNTLALRTKLDGNPTFRQAMGRVRETALAAYAHQDLPFEKLVEELQPARSQSYNPIFQAMFILQNTSRPINDMTGLKLSPFEIDSGVAKFDLTISLEETSSGVSGWIEYATDLFERDTVARLIQNYRTLLESAVTNPDQTIATLTLLDKAQQHELLTEWNQTEMTIPADKILPKLFEEQAQRQPDAIAIRFQEKKLTYAELNQRANRLAHYLKEQNVGPETLVGICVERSIEMVVALLAIHKAGGAYVPLDPNYPAERLAFILDDAQPPILLTQQSLLGRLPRTVHSAMPQVICLDPELDVSANRSTENLPCCATQQNLAYVLYTSGSTGKPKGVQIPHCALLNFLLSMEKEPGFSATDILLAVTTLSFDIAGLELWLPLSVGGQVVITPAETMRDGRQLAQLMDECKATVMQATPATWRMLLQSGWQGNLRLKILCGGEGWGSDLSQALLPKCASLWNMYGPTETTIWSAVSRVRENETPMIGGPIVNTQLYILDRHLQPVPEGAAGELHIGGDGLARGYLHRAELTQEKFLTNPFIMRNGERIYKTGDLVRYRGRGRIEFLGRLDHQVKIRGFRIELGEIEAVLLSHSNIREAVVVARDGVAGGEKRLVAYIVTCQSTPPTTAELKTLVASRLPEYMVPSAFVTLDALPLTPNGKVDRKALPAPDQNRPELASNFVAPGTPMENTIAEVWARALKLEKVGTQDNFFDLGGHSLLLAQVHARLCEALKTDLSIVKLFQYPTISALAAHLTQPPPEAAVVNRTQERARLQREALARRCQISKRV